MNERKTGEAIPMPDNAHEIVENEIMPLIDKALEIAAAKGIPLVAAAQTGRDTLSARMVVPSPREIALEMILCVIMLDNDNNAAGPTIVAAAKAASHYDSIANLAMLRRIMKDAGLEKALDVDELMEAAEAVMKGEDIEAASARVMEGMAKRASGESVDTDDLLDELLEGDD